MIVFMVMPIGSLLAQTTSASIEVMQGECNLNQKRKVTIHCSQQGYDNTGLHYEWIVWVKDDGNNNVYFTVGIVESAQWQSPNQSGIPLYLSPGTYTAGFAITIDDPDKRQLEVKTKVFTIASCNVNHTVTYNGNGNTGGLPPADSSSPYEPGHTVTVLDNTGSLVKTDYTFNGWNTQADGLGTNYVAGNTFSMPSSNVTMYAKWKALTSSGLVEIGKHGLEESDTAIFKLYNESNEQVGQTAYISNGVKHFWDDLPYGQYYVIETVPPGYGTPAWSMNNDHSLYLQGTGNRIPASGTFPITADESWMIINIDNIVQDETGSNDSGDVNDEKITMENITEETEVLGIEESSPWLRNRPLTCYQVWINQYNQFEFVFWWEYKNNNWVKIYDMAGGEVFSIDMKYGDARFIADLPDGMYTVKTFHKEGKMLQEFVIGKP